MNADTLSTYTAVNPPSPPADADAELSADEMATPPIASTGGGSEPPAAPEAPIQASDGEAAANDDDDDDRAANEREPYDFERCTALVALQLLPADGDPRGRPVVIGVRSHLDAPIIEMVREAELGPLPSVVSALLERLRAELPERERMHREAEAREHAEAEARKARLNTSRTTGTTGSKSASRRTKGKRDLSAAPKAAPSATPTAAPAMPTPPAVDDQPVQQLLFG